MVYQINFNSFRLMCGNGSLYLAFVFFVILNAPSIKNFIPTEVMNILPFCMMLTYILAKRDFSFHVDKVRLLYMLFLSAFFIMLFGIGFLNSLESFSFLFLIKYLTIWFTMMLAALVVTKKSIEYFVHITILWGAFMAFSVITGFFDLSRIHYLQIGHPIAISLIVSTVFFFTSRSFMFRVLLAFSIYLSLTALMSLYGRSPLIFPIIVLLLLLMYKVFLTNKMIVIVLVSSMFIVGSVVYNWFLSVLPRHIVDRLVSMFENADEEPRFELWGRTLDYILQNPFGYGLEASWHLVGYTPHNFILEILLSSGFLGLIPYLALLAIWFYLGLMIFKMGTFAIAIFGASLYYFLRFQVGGEIGSSYDFFILLLLSISYINFSRIKGHANGVNFRSNPNP